MATTSERRSLAYHTASKLAEQNLKTVPFIEHYKFYARAQEKKARGDSLSSYSIEDKARLLIVHRNLSIVYFIAATDVGLIKIGRTVNLKKRFISLQTSSPVKLDVVHSIQYDYDLETRIHEHLAEYRAHGEWFQACKPVIRFIRAIKDNGIGWLVEQVGDAGPNWDARIQNRPKDSDEFAMKQGFLSSSIGP